MGNKPSSSVDGCLQQRIGRVCGIAVRQKHTQDEKDDYSDKSGRYM